MLINLLIIFFIIIILYQLFLSESTYNFNNNIIEGLSSQGYQPYDLNNPGNALIFAPRHRLHDYTDDDDEPN